MNRHQGRGQDGLRLHRDTLKKANTSIASFLDSQLVFQLAIRTAYRVAVLQRHQKSTALLLIKWIGSFSFELTSLCVIILWS